MYQHSHVEIRQREMIRSEARTAAMSTVSYFVKVQLQDRGRQPDSLHIAAMNPL